MRCQEKTEISTFGVPGSMSKEHKLWINGCCYESEDIRVIKSPYDEKEVARIHFAGPEHVKQAVDASACAFERTKKLSGYERFKVLDQISSGISEKKEEFARSIAETAGKPIRSARVETDRAVNTFAIASEEAKRIRGEILPLDLLPQTKNRWGVVRRFPLGIIAGISPFNFPLNLVAHKVAPALAAGNSFLCRPASQVSSTALLLDELIREMDFIDGGFQAFPCGYKAAEKLIDAEAVKMVTFTGSPAIGWGLKQRAHKKKVTLELGGNAAVVIEPDADLDFALQRTLAGAFAYSGQVCISIQRIFLHESIYDRFLGDFTAAAGNLKMGDPLDESTDIGPMINAAAALQAEEWINEAAEKGGRILCGGKREGSMVEPTVLERVDPRWRISWLEAFAPVAVVYPYRDFENAIAAVNNSIYGLQAGVFTHDLKKAFQAYEALDVGGVIVNDIPTFRVDHMPYGGVKESGFGREGLKYAIEEMTELKLMAINLEN